MIATDLRKYVPARLLAALERLYMENPGAMAQFEEMISEPPHTLSLTLHFSDHRLAYSERRETAK